MTEQSIKVHKIRQKRVSRPEVKFGWVLIAIGLISGGLVGIFQSPPPTTGDGWSSSKSYLNEIRTLVIPDQNGDEINDLFVWHNAQSYQYDSEDNRAWNLTAGMLILNGKTGEILQMRKLDAEGPLYQLYAQYPMIRTIRDDIICGVAKMELVSGKLDNENISAIKAELIRINLKDLTISARANITANGWESPIPSEWNPRSDMSFAYIPNFEGLKIPNSTYTKDVIMFNNRNYFLNDTGTGANSSLVVFSFIDPTTLKQISQTNLSDNTFTMNFKLCELPHKDIEMGWYSNYFAFVKHSYFTEKQYNISIGTIDKFTTPNNIQWLVKPLEYARGPQSFNANMSDSIAFVMANGSGNFTGLAFLERNFLENAITPTNNGISSNYFSAFDSTSKKYSVNAARITCIDFQNPALPLISFQHAGKINPTMENDLGINNTDSNDIPIDIVVTQEGTNSGNNRYGLNSLAILTSNQQIHTIEIANTTYPYIEFKGVFLKPDAVGTGSNPNKISYNLSSGSVAVINTNGTYRPYHMHTKPITNFDLDQDGYTDLVFPGTSIDLANIELSQTSVTKPINGPYFAISRNGAIQGTFMAIQYISDIWLTEDMNNDSISDVGFRELACLFSKTAPSPGLTWLESKLTDHTFYFGCAMAALGLLVLILTLIMLSSEGDVKFAKRRGYLWMIGLAAILIIILYSLLMNLQSQISQNAGDIQIGSTPEAMAMSNVFRVSGYASLAFVTLLPITLGLYVLWTPSMAENVVVLNSLMYAKKAGYQAVKKKKAIENTEKLAKVDYRIAIIPPFGKAMSAGGLASRVVSILALAISIGLYFFKYLGDYLYNTSTFVSFESLTDPNFAFYIQALFLTLIIPGIVAIPFFVWLIPASWLLDDAGVLYYIRSTVIRKPEDVESVATWFSGYLKGFLGISALFNYIEFIVRSPILNSPGILQSQAGTTVLLFAFGFIIVAGLSIGTLAVIIHEIAMPYSASRLYSRLEHRKMDTISKAIDFRDVEKLSEEACVQGFLGNILSSLPNPDDSQKSDFKVNQKPKNEPNKSIEKNVQNKPDNEKNPKDMNMKKPSK